MRPLCLQKNEEKLFLKEEKERPCKKNNDKRTKIEEKFRKFVDCSCR